MNEIALRPPRLCGKQVVRDKHQIMKSNPRHLAIALAGLFQAVKLVQQTATGRYRDSVALNACLTGLFNTDPESPEAVFGDMAGIQSGLETALGQISNEKGRRDLELTRYAITVLYLERKLARHRAMLDGIRAAIDRTRGLAEFHDLTQPDVIASLAAAYKQTVSTLRPQVLVNGNPEILGNPDNQNLIRTLLLAAIRAAVLWRQCGGGRLTLVLRRKALQEALESLLHDLHPGR
jgi:high frequency lysogenization protein